jgi:hypothetical protein
LALQAFFPLSGGSIFSLFRKMTTKSFGAVPMAWFKKLFASFMSLFGKRKPKVVPAGAAADAAVEVCALNYWIGEIRKHRQLYLLLHCGVSAWNFRIETGDKFWPDLSGVNLHDKARADRAMIWGKPADLVGGERLVLAGINLACANLEGVQFVPHDIIGHGAAIDSSTQACGADLRRANLAHVKLQKARLSLSNLESANLQGADLRDADLRKANFARADLRNANMLDARLEGANFAWADLSGAIFSANSLEGANLFGAKLSHTSVLGYQPTGLVFGRNLLSNRVRLVPTLHSAWS